MRTVMFHFFIGLLLGGLAGGGTYYIFRDDTIALIVGTVAAVLYWIIVIAVRTGITSSLGNVFDVFED